MTTEKLEEVLRFYRSWFSAKCIKPARQEDGKSLEHLHWMINECLCDLLPDERYDKAMRWLGYVEGVLVAGNHFTLTETRGLSHS